MEKDTAQALPLEIVSVHGSGTLLMGAKIIFFFVEEKKEWQLHSPTTMITDELFSKLFLVVLLPVSSLETAKK